MAHDLIETGFFDEDPTLTDAGAVKTTWLTDEHVIQAPRVGEAYRIALNTALYEELAETAVPVPRVHDSSVDPPAYGVYERHNEPDLGALYGEIDEATELSLIEEAGRIQGAMHQVAIDGYGYPDGDRPIQGSSEDWASFFEEYVQDSLEYCAPVLADETIEQIGSIVTAARIPSEPPSRIIHNDYHPGNLLGDEDGITAVIDFDNAIYGDQIYDLQRSKGMVGLEAPGEPYDHDRVQAFERGYKQEQELPTDEASTELYDLAARTEWMTAMMYHYKEGTIDEETITEQAASLRSYVDEMTGSEGFIRS